MTRYKVNIELLTEAIFGSGHSIPGSVDLEIVYDEYGLPYMKGKTFKGNLREQMEKVNQVWDSQFNKDIDLLLGKPGSGNKAWKSLRFSDCRLQKGVRRIIKDAVDKKKIDPSEVKQALTHVRNFTSIEADGSHKNGSLRQMRVIKKGLNFEVEINYERDLKDKELGLLAASLLQLRHIGTMRTRGKGEVRCSLHVLENGSYRDITADYFNLFLKEVNYNE